MLDLPRFSGHSEKHEKCDKSVTYGKGESASLLHLVLWRTENTVRKVGNSVFARSTCVMTSWRRTCAASSRSASWRFSSGAMKKEEYYRDGEGIAGRPRSYLARPQRLENQQYYRDGRFLREDGWAVIKGRPLKEEMHPPLSVIPGVTGQRPAPKAPDRPSASARRN
jgi:hypothetical protein